MTDAPIMLSAAEVAIIKKLRAAELIEALAWYDDHAWKMLIAVGRQLSARQAGSEAKRPAQQKSYREEWR